MMIEDFKQLLPFKPYSYQEEYLKGIQQAFNNKRNYLISMPTGTGKSLALEYCANDGKTIYTVPIRALANEKLEELPITYSHLKILRDTGQDYKDRQNFTYIEDVIITTNERLLSILNNKISSKVFENVKYIVFDEIHMVGDINRGSILEWIIMLLKTKYPNIMIIGLSATLPNYKEFAEWLNADFYYMDDSKRPIPLEFYFGQNIPERHTMGQRRDFKFGQLVKYTYQFKEQFLVFMSSKRDIEKYARQFVGVDQNAPLSELMEKGIAFHHADIEEEYKKKVIDEFKAGTIRIIFCSPTLAVGVNLPATNCVIFDMSYWNDIAYEHIVLPYDKLTQMMGRAGRVGYSDVGRVILLGTKEELDYGKEIINSPQDMKSQFGRVVIDKILNMITNKPNISLTEIYEIIKQSFLFHQHENFDIETIIQAINLLQKYFLIEETQIQQYMATKRGYLTIKMYIPVYVVIEASQNLKFLTDDLSSLLVFFLANEQFLNGVQFTRNQTDRQIVNRTSSKFNFVDNKIWVYIYDHIENIHIKRNKYNEFLKIIGFIFKDDVLIPKISKYIQKTTLWKYRTEGSRLISTLKVIFEKELNNKNISNSKLELLSDMVKYGTLDKNLLDMIKLPGIGELTAEKLINHNIKSKTDLLNTPDTTLKALGIRNYRSIKEHLRTKTKLNVFFN